MLTSPFSWARALFAVLTCFTTITDVSPLKLVKTSPKHIHVRTDYTSVNFTCETDGPISECQFRWRNEIRKRSGPILDLSEGLKSSTNESYLGKDVIWYHYSGKGLDAGQCGVTLHIKGVKQYSVSCRVRAENSGWKYGLMSLFADNYAQVPVEVSQMQQVAVGEELSLMCKSDRKLNSCRFHLPGFGLVIMDAGRESASPSTHQYYGAGLEQGECGLTLKAKEINNGMVTCTVDTSRRDLEWNTIPLIVTRPPDWINLEVTKMPDTDADPVFQARCTVGGSRPAANLIWLLDDEVQRKSDENEDLNATWTWPYQPQTVTQVFQVPVTKGAPPRKLTCQAEHPTLEGGKFEKSKILALETTQCSVADSEAVDMTCTLNEEEVNCSNAMVGTVQEMSCKPGYVKKDKDLNDTRQCQQGGAWDKELIKCIPDCGRLVHQSNAAVEQKDGLVGDFPWHVGIYQNKNGTFKYICGGSLISTKYVISGAQRFWDSNTKQKKDPALFRVATGKGTREWIAKENPQVQKRNVMKVDFHDQFSGFEGQFKYDIALVKLSIPFLVTDLVNVICIDWEGHWEKTHLQDNNTGMLVGQGFTKNGSLADDLSYVNVTFLLNTTCIEKLPEPMKDLLTEDKFCAKSENENKSLCSGDIGGGLVFPEPDSGKYYLRGIASVGFQEQESCTDQYHIGFTSIAAYIEWINGITGLFPSLKVTSP